MASARSVMFVSRRLASGGPMVRFNSDVFGSIHRSDIRVDRLVRPSTANFDTPKPARRIKELHEPLSLSKKRRERLEKLQSKETPPAPHQCFIECSRTEFNQLDCNPDMRTAICSQYWTKNKYSGDWFIIKRKTKQPSTQFVKWENAWDHYVPDLLDPLIKEVLDELGLKRPTYTQTQCLQVFPSQYHLFIAAETGSGKTIAYAAPLITRLLNRRRKGVKERAVVLVVTASLKEQTFSVLSKLASKTDIVVSACDKNDCSEDWDILVGTPGLVEKAFRQYGSCMDVKCLILDEADMILDESFVDVLTDIFSLIPISNSITNPGDESTGSRVIFCSATCPEELECIADGVVDRRFLRYIKSPRVHSLLSNIEMKFMRVRERDKLEILEKLLLEDMKRGEFNKTMVFCKDRATALFVHKQLESFEYSTTLWQLNKGIQDDRDARIFIATDAAARGIDLPSLSHIINYDLSPHNVGFLHRVGRVGRLSSSFPGRITSFVRTPSEVRLTNAIELSARMGRPLSGITSELSRESVSQDTENSE